jgi:hypothetical protein
MTDTIDVTVRIGLIDPLDGEDSKIREIVQAIVDGYIHPSVDEVELIEFRTEDFKKAFKVKK